MLKYCTNIHRKWESREDCQPPCWLQTAYTFACRFTQKRRELVKKWFPLVPEHQHHVGQGGGRLGSSKIRKRKKVPEESGGGEGRSGEGQARLDGEARTQAEREVEPTALVSPPANTLRTLVHSCWLGDASLLRNHPPANSNVQDLSILTLQCSTITCKANARTENPPVAFSFKHLS